MLSKFPLKYRSNKIPKKQAICRSKLEYDVFRRLDYNPDIKTFIPEPFKIQYEYKGEQRKYIPDIFILYKDSSQKLIEIKHLNHISGLKNKAKLTSAKKYCDSRKMNFEIWIRGTKNLDYSKFNQKSLNYSCWEDANKDHLEYINFVSAKEKWKKIIKLCLDVFKILFGLALWGIIIFAVIKAIF